MPAPPPSCPRCGAPLAASQVSADRVICPRCGAHLVKSGPSAAKKTAAVGNPAPPAVASPVAPGPSPSRTSGPPRRLAAVLLLTGFGMFTVAGLIAAVIVIGLDGPTTAPEPANPEFVVPLPKAR